MAIKIDAPRAWANPSDDGKIWPDFVGPDQEAGDFAVRIVRESDWRKIMAVVKSVDEAQGPTNEFLYGDEFVLDAIIALRKHLRKRK